MEGRRSTPALPTVAAMLIVTGILSVEPADHDRMVELIEPLVQATLAEEGNVTYGFYVSPTEPGVFRPYEEWESQDAIDAHMATEHMGTFLASMGELAVTGTELHLHEVASSNRLM